MKPVPYLALGEVARRDAAVSASLYSTPADKVAMGLLALLYAVLCGFTWHKWGTLPIDCGREMWVPAAIDRGRRLYFDIWYPYGPLIPYWHALLFRIFGIHLSVLYSAGLGIAVILLGLIYRLGRIFLPVSLSFTVSFAFLAMAMQLNLFNYILPYSYPAAYGALLFAALLWLLVRDCFHETRFRIVAIGIFAAAALLTKIEVGMGAYGLLGFAMVIRAWRKDSWAYLVRDALLCLPAFLVAAGVYGFMVYGSSLQFIFADNIAILPQSYFVQHFNHRWAEQVGFTTNPLRILLSVYLNLVGTGVTLCLLSVCAASRLSRWLCVAAALGLCALNVKLMFGEPVFGWPVPDAIGAIAAYVFFSPALFWSSAVLLYLSGRSLWRRKQSPDVTAVALLSAASLVLGVRTMTKMAPSGYPVFYAILPYLSWIVLIYYVCAMLRIPISPAFRRGVAAMLCAGIVALTFFEYSQAKPFRIATERGDILTDATTGPAFSEVLSFLQSAKAASKPFVIWPQECALYFFSETNAPSRWHTVTPGVLPPGPKTAGYLADLDAQGIQYVVLSSLTMKEHGTPVFGEDYDQELYAWLQRNFRPLRTMGVYRRGTSHWAAIVYERKHGALELR